MLKPKRSESPSIFNRRSRPKPLVLPTNNNDEEDLFLKESDYIYEDLSESDGEDSELIYKVPILNAPPKSNVPKLPPISPTSMNNVISGSLFHAKKKK